MAEDKKVIRVPHNLILEDRKHLTVSGVSDIDSFDEETVVVYTQMGELTIKGSDLHINALNIDTGELTVEGNMYSFVYSDVDKSKGSFFPRFLNKSGKWFCAENVIFRVPFVPFCSVERGKSNSKRNRDEYGIINIRAGIGFFTVLFTWSGLRGSL